MKPLNNASPPHSHPCTDSARCIVVELGASRLKSAADSFDETVIVTQTSGELPAAFAQRVSARVERSRRHFQSLALLIGDRLDGPARAARRRIVLELAAHAGARAESTELLLEASPQGCPELHAELFGLVEEALRQSSGRPVPVRLVFGTEQPHQPPRRSGIFPVVAHLRAHQQLEPTSERLPAPRARVGGAS